MEDRAWDLLYAAPLDVLERAFLAALEQIKDDERPLSDKVIAYLDAARRKSEPGRVVAQDAPE